MRSIGRCRLEEFIYRFVKALFLTAFLIYFQNKYNIISDIESIASVVKKSRGVITIDTAMAHISAQVGTPEVVLYGAQLAKKTAPLNEVRIDIYNPKTFHNCRRYACKYCNKFHMPSIPVEQVFNAIMSLI